MVRSAKRRRVSAIDEISFDSVARVEFLTGFHKRKQQRIAHAKEQAQRRGRVERIRERKKVREKRKQELEEQLAAAQTQLRDNAYSNEIANDSVTSEGSDHGDFDIEVAEPEELKSKLEVGEYIDEGRFTTVTVEPVEISKYGTEILENPLSQHTKLNLGSDEINTKVEITTDKADPCWRKEDTQQQKVRTKKKFRYETSAERKKARAKVKLKKSLQSKRRRNQG